MRLPDKVEVPRNTLVNSGDDVDITLDGRNKRIHISGEVLF